MYVVGAKTLFVEKFGKSLISSKHSYLGYVCVIVLFCCYILEITIVSRFQLKQIPELTLWLVIVHCSTVFV